MAEKPKPEFPTPMAVTRHPKLFRPRVGLTTLGQPRLSEGAQPYPIQLCRDAVPTLPKAKPQHPIRSPFEFLRIEVGT